MEIRLWPECINTTYKLHCKVLEEETFYYLKVQAKKFNRKTNEISVYSIPGFLNDRKIYGDGVTEAEFDFELFDFGEIKDRTYDVLFAVQTSVDGNFEDLDFKYFHHVYHGKYKTVLGRKILLADAKEFTSTFRPKVLDTILKDDWDFDRSKISSIFVTTDDYYIKTHDNYLFKVLGPLSDVDYKSVLRAQQIEAFVGHFQAEGGMTQEEVMALLEEYCADMVSSFNGRSGPEITPMAGDYTDEQITLDEPIEVDELTVLENLKDAITYLYNKAVTIRNAQGTALPAQSNLKFSKDFNVTNDSVNEATVVEQREFTDQEMGEIFTFKPVLTDFTVQGVVKDSTELTNPDSYPYYYVGMIISVKSAMKAYMLTAADLTDPNNWKEVGSMIPAGGAKGDVLVKRSATDGDAEWKRGGGHVVQNNGTVLTQRDILDFKNFDLTDDSTNAKTVVKPHRLTQSDFQEIFAGASMGGGSTLPILLDESGTEYQVGWYKYSDNKKKPIYRKTIYKSNFQIKSTFSFDHLVTNFERLISVSAIGTILNESSYVGGVQLNFNNSCYADATKITIQTGSAWDAKTTQTWFFTYCYTKSSDTAS